MAGLLAGAAQADVQEAASGKALYARFCSSCHGLDARGGTSMGKLFLAPPPDLTRIAERRKGWFPEVLIREIIDGRFAAHGVRTMPVWGLTLSETQLTAITEHLYAMQAPGSQPAE